MDIVTTVDLDGMPEGSVLQNCHEVVVDGEKCWRGMWCSMMGSYMETVRQADAEEYAERKFEITEEMKASPAYQALLELWKKQR